jgi:hypothetical protein
MRDGTPNGWSILSVEGARFRLRFHAARQPASEQLAIFAPAAVPAAQAGASEVLVNVYAGSAASTVEMKLGRSDAWRPLERVERPDPFYAELLAREATLVNGPGRKLPPAADSLHLWRGLLPADPAPGTYTLEVRTQDLFGQRFKASRRIRIE